MEDNLFIYILKLEQNKYYIGKTKDLFTRFDAHKKGTASNWTKKYKPIFVDRVIERASVFDEDKYTKEYMNKYGIDNVRGGAYVMDILPEDQINLLMREITMANDLCMYCGIGNHFISNCKSKISNNSNLNNTNYNNVNNNTNFNNVNNNKVINNTNNTNKQTKINKTNKTPKSDKANKGKKWDIEEENRLCNSYNLGTPISEIAKNHQRTEYAIKKRLQKLGKID